jgi:hypothetical protein
VHLAYFMSMLVSDRQGRNLHLLMANGMTTKNYQRVMSVVLLLHHQFNSLLFIGVAAYIF